MKPVSKFSISEALNPKKTEEKATQVTVAEDLPSSHFTETDVQTEWSAFLENIRTQDVVIYNAVNGFRLHKQDENTVLICYPSESAKVEFEKIQADFFNHFKHKVNNFSIKTEFRMEASLKKEVMTKKKMFEKFAEINPLLRELDDLVKFDLS